jgi:hypothetical protein
MENPVIRDRHGKLIKYKPREKTWLKIENPKQFANIAKDGYSIEQSLFSEVIENIDNDFELRSDVLLRESLTMAKRLVHKIRTGYFATMADYENDSDVIDLAFLADKANICPHCYNAKRSLETRYFDGIASDNSTMYRAKTRPMYLAVNVDGIAEYRLVCGNVLAKRVKKSKLSAAYHVDSCGNVVQTNTFVFTVKLCGCKI